MRSFELGAFEYLPKGNEWTYGQPAFKVACKGGYLLAYQTGDPGIYDEVSVDFVSDDGRLIQMAVIGRDENEDYESDGWDVADSDAFGYQPMHIYCYDGMGEEVASTQYVTISDGSHWYEH